MLTDSHCHLASPRYTPEEIPDLLERAKHAGVSQIISLMTSLDDLQANLTLANNPAVHACIGIHPCDVHQAPEDAVSRIAKFSNDPRVCAIGESGLDHYHPAPDGWAEEAFRERQQHFLHQQFELAASARLNIVIHTRDLKGIGSFEKALEIYRAHHTSVRAVFHCYNGSWENAQRIFDLGGLVSFGGVATFKNANKILDTAKKCPIGSFMVETDAPYLTPEPFRGQRNEPSFVAHTAQRLSEIRGESLTELAAHTTATACAFFRLRPDCD